MQSKWQQRSFEKAGVKGQFIFWEPQIHLCRLRIYLNKPRAEMLLLWFKWHIFNHSRHAHTHTHRPRSTHDLTSTSTAHCCSEVLRPEKLFVWLTTWLQLTLFIKNTYLYNQPLSVNHRVVTELHKKNKMWELRGYRVFRLSKVSTVKEACYYATQQIHWS